MTFFHPARLPVPLWVSLLLVPLLATIAAGQSITAAPEKATGVYDVGEPIVWRVELKGRPEIMALNYTLKQGGLTVIKEGSVDLEKGVGTVTTKLAEPGSILVEFHIAGAPVDKRNPLRGLAGAVVAPAKIAVSAPPPNDFDAFWKSKLATLADIPANPKLESAEAKPTKQGRPAIEYFKLTLDNINGSKVYGQLAKPKKAGKFPALLLVQYAGVYGLPPENVVRRAENGWLCLNIMPHDLPFDQPADFYKKQGDGPLKDYVRIGNEDRDTSYFLRMNLGCYRAAEYLTTRDDWDGTTLVVYGTSQGGYQAFVTAGLHPKVSAMLANVPAGCDTTGKQVGRAAGWPYWEGGAWGGRDKAKVMATSRYYDAVNFARNVKCPVMVSAGLIDETCPVTGVAAAVNVTQGKKELVALPLSNHHGTGNAQGPFYSKAEKWLNEMATGK